MGDLPIDPGAALAFELDQPPKRRNHCGVGVKSERNTARDGPALDHGVFEQLFPFILADRSILARQGTSYR